MRLPDFKNLHANIAADTFPKGGELRCGVCGAVQLMTTTDGARYLADGWPKCCGRTMQLFTPEQLAAEAKAQS